ncbi:MAG: type IV secretory system conjugative DNA transfer family protein, partial [Patescibacteria group bacterium]
MRDIMDKGKILIVNLAKGRIGEDNSALLGAMVITRLQLAAMSRVEIPETKRMDFFLYVDEFQNFATESFANILSEARKYRLSLILAHQYIGQLVHDKNTRVRDAIFGNVGTIISFRIGAVDAEFVEKEFLPEFNENDLVNLAKANTYVKLMIDGVASRPFSAETLPPQKPPVVSYRDVIVKNSRERYGTAKKTVEERIAREWQTESGEVVGEKIERRNERPLGEVLQTGTTQKKEVKHHEFPRPHVDIEGLRRAISQSLDMKPEEEKKDEGGSGQ